MSSVLAEKAVPTPLALTVSLTLPDDMRVQLSEGERALELVKTYQIEDADTARAVADEMNRYKRVIVFLKGWREKFLAPAKQQVETANEFFNPGIKGYEGAEAQCKRLLADWDAREQKRVALENAQREETARKARQEAEAKAAAETARANKEAEEKRRKAAEEEAAGNAARAAKLREQAKAAEENGAARATEAHLQAAATAAAMIPVTAQKVSGTQMRDKWVPKILVTDLEAKRLIVDAAAGVAIVDGKRTLVPPRTELLGVLDLGVSAIRKQAESLHEAFSIPGFEAKNEPIVAGSRK
jgi:hypothetical protein